MNLYLNWVTLLIKRNHVHTPTAQASDYEDSLTATYVQILICEDDCGYSTESDITNGRLPWVYILYFATLQI
jgi:hypothetical protein